MKTTSLLKNVIFLLSLTFIFSCKNDNSENNFIQEILKIDKVTVPNTTPKRYDVWVEYDHAKKPDTASLFIPITDERLKVKSVYNLNASHINALLIHISNGSDLATDEDPVTHVIKVTGKLNDLKLGAIKNRKEVKVVVLNENATDINKLLKEYRDCVKNKRNYDKDECLCYKNKLPSCGKSTGEDEPIVKPKEDGGDIITGG